MQQTHLSNTIHLHDFHFGKKRNSKHSVPIPTLECYCLNLHSHLPIHQTNNICYHRAKSCGQGEGKVASWQIDAGVSLFSITTDLP